MGSFRLTASAREWLVSRRATLRAAATRCDASSRAWNTLNDEITDLARRSRWDDEKTARVKAANRGLTDAYGATTFFQAEVVRLAADIQAEIAYWRAMADADDPTAAAGWPASAGGDAAVGPRPRPRPYPAADLDEVRLGGLVEPGPLVDKALRGHNSSPAGYASGQPGTQQGEAGNPTPASPARGGIR